jgi:hypothetical protein
LTWKKVKLHSFRITNSKNGLNYFLHPTNRNINASRNEKE